MQRWLRRQTLEQDPMDKTRHGPASNELLDGVCASTHFRNAMLFALTLHVCILIIAGQNVLTHDYGAPRRRSVPSTVAASCSLSREPSHVHHLDRRCPSGTWSRPVIPSEGKRPCQGVGGSDGSIEEALSINKSMIVRHGRVRVWGL
jgi:hypothetical protein